MAVVIRLQKFGRKKKQYYRIVACEKSSKRDGKAIEYLGNYYSGKKPPLVNVDQKKVEDWIKKGAQTSEAVKKILSL